MNANVSAASIIALLASSSLGGCASTPAPTPASDTRTGGGRAAAPDARGHWKSACTQTGEAQSIGLDFVLTEREWRLDYTTYGDATCTSAFVTVHVEGDYALDRPSDDVPGAWLARFGFVKKTVTPHGDAAAGFASSERACGRSGFEAGKETDVTEQGCAGLGQYPLSKCASDFDLVALEGDSLRFGDRPKDNDMCTEDKRPTALAGLVMTRVK